MESNKGFILILVLFFLALSLGLGVGLSNLVINNLKAAAYINENFNQFQKADDGIYAVAGWMYFYKRSDVPKSVAYQESEYHVYTKVLEHTVDYPVGYSTAWVGFDARLTSISNTKVVEAIVFVPVAPSGYGNGG